MARNIRLKIRTTSDQIMQVDTKIVGEQYYGRKQTYKLKFSTPKGYEDLWGN